MHDPNGFGIQRIPKGFNCHKAPSGAGACLPVELYLLSPAFWVGGGEISYGSKRSYSFFTTA